MAALFFCVLVRIEKYQAFSWSVGGILFINSEAGDHDNNRWKEFRPPPPNPPPFFSHTHIQNTKLKKNWSLKR